MAENTISLLRYLSAPTSPLPSLTAGYTRPTTVYYSHLGHFFIYSFTTAKILYGLLFGASAIFVKLTFVEPAPALKKTRGVWREQGRGMVAVVAGIVGSVLVPNIVAVIMQRVLGKGMSWFASQYSALALYGPAALLGESCSYILDQNLHSFAFRWPRFATPLWPYSRTNNVYLAAPYAIFSGIRCTNVQYRVRSAILCLCPSTVLFPGVESLHCGGEQANLVVDVCIWSDFPAFDWDPSYRSCY